MSATTLDSAAAMTVAEARQRLRDTSGLSSEQIDEAQRVLDSFRAARPANRQCVACGSMRWDEHSDAEGGACWACAGCHRSADLTAEQWYAEQTRERQAVEAHLAAAAAAAPNPRDTLREALARLEAAKTGLSKLEGALPAARATLAAAQLKHERATSDAEEVDAAAATHLVASFQETRSVGPAPSAMAARTALAAADDGLAAARAAKALLDEQLSDRRSAVATAQAFARKAALGVIAAEQLEELLTEAAEARAAYLESVGALGWLLRHGANPSSDARARQLVAGADTPPSTWREAATAGTTHMEDALAALLTATK